MQWYFAVMSKYAVFDGRARRKEYWMFFLFNIIIAMVIGFVTGFTSALLGIGTTLSDSASTIYSLAVLIPGIAVGIRRMHDIGQSGWWILVPFVNLWFLCRNGQAGENEYGPDPKIA